MRLSSIGSATGWLAVAAVLLLSAPGVHIARADEAPDLIQVGTPESGPSCGIPSEGQIHSVHVEGRLQLEMARIRALLEAKNQRSVDPELAGDQPIALNNRGYNYRPSGPIAN